MTAPNKSSELPPFEEMHRVARAAYLARDVDAYMGVMSPDLVYRQLNGKCIGRDELARSVQVELERVSAADWNFEVQHIEQSGDSIVARILQKGQIATRAFLIIHRLWKLYRVGNYVYRKTDGEWKISEVAILEESVAADGVSLGFKPRLPNLATA